MKYLVISIKIKLTLEGEEPEKHDTALRAAYVTLFILNVLSPLVESTFVVLGDDSNPKEWVPWRITTQTVTFSLQTITFIILIFALFRIHVVLKGEKNLQLVPKSVYAVTAIFLLFLLGVGVNNCFLSENVSH